MGKKREYTTWKKAFSLTAPFAQLNAAVREAMMMGWCLPSTIYLEGKTDHAYAAWHMQTRDAAVSSTISYHAGVLMGYVRVEFGPWADKGYLFETDDPREVVRFIMGKMSPVDAEYGYTWH